MERLRSLGIKGNSLVISVTEFIHDSGGHLINPFWSLYFLSLDGSLGTLALMTAVQGLCGLFFQPLWGYLSDRFGRKNPIIIGGFIEALGRFITVFATHWTGLIPGQIASGISSGLWPVREALFADSTEPERRGVGFASFYSIMQIGSIFMPAIGGRLLDSRGMILGMRIALIYSGSVIVIQTVLNAKFLAETVERNVETENRGHNGEGDKRIDFVSRVEGSFNTLFPVFSSASLRVMVVGFAIMTFGSSILGRFMSVYAVNSIGISNTEWGLVQSTSGVINVIARVPFGLLTDRYGRRKLIVISYFIRPIFLLFFVHSRSLPQVLAAQSLSTLARDVESPAWQALVADLTPRTERGRVYVSFRMISSAFSIVAPTIGALLWETYGPVWAFYSTILVEMPAAFFFYLFLKEPASREK